MKTGRVLPGGAGTLPAWHRKKPAAFLPTSSIFRDSLVPDLCWKLWPGPRQPGWWDLLRCWNVWGRETKTHATEWSKKDTLSQSFVFLIGVIWLFEMAQWGHSPTGRAQCNSLRPREQRSQLYTISLLDQPGSNLSSATSQLCDLGQITELLSASFSSSVNWDSNSPLPHRLWGLNENYLFKGKGKVTRMQ